MAATVEEVRQLLRWPVDIPDETIQQHIDDWTIYVANGARDDSYSVSSTYQVSSAEQDAAVRWATLHSVLTMAAEVTVDNNQEEQRKIDNRFSAQLKQVAEMRDRYFRMVLENPASTFYIKVSSSRME